MRIFAEIDYTARHAVCHVLVWTGVLLTAIAGRLIRAGAWIIDMDIELYDTE